jgi:hypothetical protein
MQISDLTQHEYIKPAIWGAVIGAVAMVMIGFWGMGWTTAATAKQMAGQSADAAVVGALVPFCVAKAEQDGAAANLAKFYAEEASYKRSQIVQDSGWATMPGSTSSNYALASSCSEKLAALQTK